MQLIEVSEIGVRASMVRMTSHTARLKWVLFPMIHLGPADYYAEVERRMLGCDLVLAEGVDSQIVQAITMSYRAAGGSERLNTVVQPRFHSASSGPEVVNADISAAEFDESWNQLPLKLRIGIPLAAPLYGVGFAISPIPRSSTKRWKPTTSRLVS